MSIQSTFIDQTFQSLRDSLSPDGTVSFKHMMRLAIATKTDVYVMGTRDRFFTIVSQMGEYITLSPVAYPGKPYMFKEQPVLPKVAVVRKTPGWTLSVNVAERGKVDVFVIFQESDIYKRFQELLTPSVSPGQPNHDSRTPNPMLPLEDRIVALEKEVAELKETAEAQATINRELLDVVRKLAELARPRSTGVLS